MNQDLSPLIEYLDKQFAGINRKLEEKDDKKDVNNLISTMLNIEL